MKESGMKSGKLSLFSLTWPLFIETLFGMLIGSTDTFMLSSLSDEAVAAVGVANQLINFTLLLFSVIATGTSVVIAQYLGAGKPGEAGRVAAISITLNFFIGLLVSGSVVLGRGGFLGLFQLSETVHAYGDVYLLWVGATLFTQSLLVTASSILRAHGFTRDAMLVSLFMNLVHIFGNSTVIYGLFGMPKLGVFGVALSTGMSRTLAMLLIFYLMFRRLPYSFTIKDLLSIDGRLLKQILHVGLPSAGEQISYNTSQMVITGMIALLGTAALSTRIYAWTIMSFIFLVGISIGQGTQILIGHLVGAGEFNRAYKQLLRSLRISFFVTLAVAGLVAYFRLPLLDLFTDDPVILGMGGVLLLLTLILEPGRTFNLVVISSLRAAGDAQFPVMMGILSMWGVSVTLSYLLGIYFGLGLVGFWIAFMADEWLRGIIMYFRWRSRIWERKSLIAKMEPEYGSSSVPLEKPQ
ncbi:MATE family efflux transporter [Thermicanus aegyptius]|uniref:MATE family efflux transporter n=1 Tax=Thermicanus aegyptius TaxID=94009 RepID=UPI00058706C6|nr:MATE family efflux transporter [Thermicanus aegyptius]